MRFQRVLRREGKALRIAIHVAHFAWATALWIEVQENGFIESYRYFFPMLGVALLLEMRRWTTLGTTTVQVHGPYSTAAAIDRVNREFLSFSWYVPPPIPPFKLVERYAASVPEMSRQHNSGRLFSDFWLKSEMAAALIGALAVAYALVPGSPPYLYGLGQFLVAKYLFWFFGFGIFGKVLAIAIYSLLINLLNSLQDSLRW